MMRRAPISSFPVFTMATLAMVLGALGVAAVGVSGGCASRRAKDGRDFVEIRSLVPYNVHVRRPPYAPVDPKAGPGGVDYRASPTPNERYDCEPLSWLFRELDLPAIRACMAELNELSRAETRANVARMAGAAVASPSPRPEVPAFIAYRLRRESSPYFEVSQPELVPACVSAALARIPLPREIFFQSEQEGSLQCYGARLPLEEDELFWVKVPMARVELRLELPFESVPADDEQMRLQLFSWVMSPFWMSEGGKGRALRAKFLPDALCRSCLGEKNLLRAPLPPGSTWP